MLCSKVNKISIHSIKYAFNILYNKAKNVILTHTSVSCIHDNNYNHITNKVHSELETNKSFKGFLFSWEEHKLKHQSSVFLLRIVDIWVACQCWSVNGPVLLTSTCYPNIFH